MTQLRNIDIARAVNFEETYLAASTERHVSGVYCKMVWLYLWLLEDMTRSRNTWTAQLAK
jgi:hypothetical protein